MPKVKVDDTLETVYRVDDFTDPWEGADTILLVHGGLETEGTLLCVGPRFIPPSSSNTSFFKGPLGIYPGTGRLPLDRR